MPTKLPIRWPLIGWVDVPRMVLRLARLTAAAELQRLAGWLARRGW